MENGCEKFVVMSIIGFGISSVENSGSSTKGLVN
jgi:hypothetical protein